MNNDITHVVNKNNQWNNIYLDMAHKIADFSTCCKLKVGAVLVKDNYPISIGYNGVPAKMLHCNEYYYNKYNMYFREKYLTFETYLESEDFKKEHSTWSPYNEIHAEVNCILQACKRGISTANSILYITHSPCIYCAPVIISAGIISVYIGENRENKVDDGLSFLKLNKISIVNLKRSAKI